MMPKQSASCLLPWCVDTYVESNDRDTEDRVCIAVEEGVWVVGR
jgi:hypothetical protein